MELTQVFFGILGNWFWWLIMLGAGIVGAYLRKRGSQWPPVILNGLLSAGLVGLIIFVINVQYNFVVQQRSITTTENIKGRVRSWLDEFHLTNTSEASNDAYFRYIVNNPGEIKIIISRMKEHDRSLVFTVTLHPKTDQEKKFIEKLSEADRKNLQTQIIIEAARLGIGFNLDPSFKTLYLEKGIPITGMTGDVLMSTILQMQNAVLIIQNIFTAGIEHRKLIR